MYKRQAYYKAQEAAGCILPTSGKVLVTVSDRDKKFIESIAQIDGRYALTLVDNGYDPGEPEQPGTIITAVSYTHLDVYKRQVLVRPEFRLAMFFQMF